jgi:radical SAM-linked protein
MYRLRIRFSRGEEVKFISHLDIMRFWERALRRAQVPLAYSEGFTPHPRLSLAAPLALGVTSETEFMDIVLQRWVSPHWLTDGITQQLPTGFKVLAAFPVPMTLPSLQSSVRFAEYQVEVEPSCGREDLETAIEKLLSQEELQWHHQRDTGEHNYDLRALIEDVWVVDWPTNLTNDKSEAAGVLAMNLRCDVSGSGRPEQVILALGIKGYPRKIHRTKLVLAAPG